jgi:hypothetical protein
MIERMRLEASVGHHNHDEPVSVGGSTSPIGGDSSGDA